MLPELLSRNWIWLMIVGVVAITQWSKCRDLEMKSQSNLRLRQMEHQQRMKELEMEIEKVRRSVLRT